MITFYLISVVLSVVSLIVLLADDIASDIEFMGRKDYTPRVTQHTVLYCVLCCVIPILNTLIVIAVLPRVLIR